MQRYINLAITLAFVAVSTSVHAVVTAEFTVAAFNVENLFDVFDNPYKADERTPAKPRTEIKACAEAIRALNADIIGLSEIENEGVIAAMNSEMLRKQGYKYVASLPSNDPRGITLGILSRHPIASVTSYRWRTLKTPDNEKTYQFARDVLHAKVMVAAESHVHVLVTHLKSKRTVDEDDPQSGNWRLAESLMIRKIVAEIQEREPNASIIVIGDLNDTPDSKVIEALLGGKDDASRLIDTHAHIKPENRITYLREPYLSTIDYIFVSKNLAKFVDKKTSKVVTDKKLLEGSDHAPVVTTFKLVTE